MSDNDAINGVVETGGGSLRIGFEDKREIRVSAMVEIAHMHPTVEHDSLSIDGNHNAALPHLLPCA